MLNSFEDTFDYEDFKKKLKHYFSDTAPIYAKVKILATEVQVTYNESIIHIPVDNNLGVKENVGLVIKFCENSLYPRMLEIIHQSIVLSHDRIKSLLIQGLTLDQIHKKQIKKFNNYYILTRFNIRRNSIDYREAATERIYRAHFNRPLLIYRDKFLNMANEGQESMKELYKLIKENSKIEELIQKDD